MADALDRYRKKRDFARTPEPDAQRTADQTSKAPSFVVQKHAARRLHYDLRLEHDGVLKSWAVTRGPSAVVGDKRLAVETEDHPLAYGSFEGTIPKGSYGAGTVMVWDRGTWAMVDGKDADEGFAHGSLSFELFGERMRGRWHLQRLKDEGKRAQWLLIKSRDEHAVEPDENRAALTDAHTTSVLSGRPMEAIAQAADATWQSDRPARSTSRRAARVLPIEPAGKEAKGDPLPDFVAPQLCVPRAAPPKGEDWLAELKYDGYRMLLRATDGAVRLLTRTNKDWTQRFPTIIAEAAPLAPRNVMLDGEVVVFEADGRTDFGALQRAFKSGGAVGVSYVAFDALFLDGKDLRGEPIEARKALLADLVKGHRVLRYGDHVPGGQQGVLFDKARELGLEGIVAKRAGSRYRSGRHASWVKVRAARTGEFVIGAYTEAQDGSDLGALVVGAYHGEALVPLGRVGTGFGRSAARDLREALDARRTRRSPFSAPLAGRGQRYVRPELIAKVEYLTVTGDGQLRSAAYKGLVEGDPRAVALPSQHPLAEADRSSASATSKRGAAMNATSKTAPARGGRDKPVDVLGVSISSPHKVLFPEQNVTKLALAEHYVVHMDRLLPHIAGRPLTLMRCPQGRQSTCFYQRHPEGLPARMARPMPDEEGDAIVANEPADIIALVQRGTLEVHLRGSRVDRPTRPDRLVFDLDPGEGVTFDELKRGAFTVREALAELDLTAFVKSTGGKGLHVVVPIERRTEWADAKAWCRAFCAGLAKAEPDRFLISMKKAARSGRIFLDYLRNDRKASAVAPYSCRARVGAPFGRPLAWDELAEMVALPDDHVGKVIDGPDPWEALPRVRQRLSARAASIRKS